MQDVSDVEGLDVEMLEMDVQVTWVLGALSCWKG